MSEAAGRSSLSIIIPCFNEEEVLAPLRARLLETLERLDLSWEVVCVDDGSSDRTLELLSNLHHQDERFKVVGLSRNFGHQAAIAAGLRYATGDAVTIMDADLQDPPEVLTDCIQRWREGYDVIFAIRQSRPEGVLKRAAYKSFYRVLKAIADIEVPLDSGDFCLMDRRVADVLREMPERNIFMRGMRAWSGFRQIGVAYRRDPRIAGRTKYPAHKLFHLAFDGIISFSTLPLRLATWFGLLVVLLCFVAVGLVVIWRIFGLEFMGHTAKDIPGWAAGIVSVLFLGGVQLLILGVMGEYLGRIYGEVKLRPRWVVRTALGFCRKPGQVE